MRKGVADVTPHVFSRSINSLVCCWIQIKLMSVEVEGEREGRGKMMRDVRAFLCLRVSSCLCRLAFAGQSLRVVVVVCSVLRLFVCTWLVVCLSVCRCVNEEFSECESIFSHLISLSSFHLAKIHNEEREHRQQSHESRVCVCLCLYV